jgi:multidrug efflux pump subunit AcrB
LLFIGAWWLLILFQIPFGFAAQLGMFGLIWVGVNNAILLIERYNEIWGLKRNKRSEENWGRKRSKKGEVWRGSEEVWRESRITGFDKQDCRIKGQDSRINGADVEIKKEILLEVVKSRLKPVFLTTLTTVLGLVTLALKDDLWWSLALSFMWGLIVWTLITLIYIPAVLMLMDDANLENPT